LRFYGLGIGYIPPRIVPCQDSLVESFSVAVRPGMARYGQVWPGVHRKPQDVQFSARFSPFPARFQPVSSSSLVLPPCAPQGVGSFVGQSEPPENSKEHQDSSRNKTHPPWYSMDLLRKCPFNHLQHKIPSSLYTRSIQSNQSIDRIQSITYPSFVDLHHGSIWFHLVPTIC
jgi:hypothetical protein